MAGNLATGKTTLLRRLSDALGWHVEPESVDDNPYLADFYRDMRAWCFHLQIYFLGQRAKAHATSMIRACTSALDRSVYEDAHVFVPALHHLGMMTRRDLDCYNAVFEPIAHTLAPPNLIIFLHAAVPVLLQRIRDRGLACDQNIDANYLDTVADYYFRWLQSWKACPVVSVDSEEVDFRQTFALQHIILELKKLLSNVHHDDGTQP